MSKAKGVAFNRELAVRIGNAVRQVEGTPRDGRYGNLPRASAGVAYPLPATVTTDIPAGSLASPSTTGRITVYRDNDAGGIAAAETGQVCKNYHNAGAVAGKTVTVYWRAGVYWLIAIDC